MEDNGKGWPGAPKTERDLVSLFESATKGYRNESIHKVSVV